MEVQNESLREGVKIAESENENGTHFSAIPQKPKNAMREAKKKEKIFLFFFLLYPVGQALFFYLTINLNSILLAFQKYENGIISFTGDPFFNFRRVLQEIFVTGELWTPMKNSAILLVLNTVIGLPVHIIVAYAIFRKIPGSSFYKIMLFLPNMMSSMIFVISFRTLVQDALPLLLKMDSLKLLDVHRESSFWTVALFGFWLEFSGGLVIYLSAMAGIPVDVLEYGKLENLSSIKEFWYVVVPLIFSTITTYLVIGITKFFTSQGFFFSFFSAYLDPTPFDTLGYVFFARVVAADAGIRNYPYTSAAGLLFTLVIGPLTIIAKTLLEKYGPSEE